MKNLRKIEDQFQSKIDGYLSSQISKSVSRSRNRASDIGFECDTYQALCQLKGELRPRISLELKKIFRIGNEWEDPNFHLMKKSGLSVKKAAQQFYWDKFNISGTLDGWAEIEHPETGENIEIPLEHKTASPNSFRSIVKYKEADVSLIEAKETWLRKYPAQLMTYMLFKGIDYGFWYFFEKSSGQDLWWLMKLDLDYSENLLQRAERCNRNVEKGIIPKPTQKDICNKCDYSLTYCYPDCEYGPGFAFLSDTEAEEKLERRESLKESHLEYGRLDKLLKGHFRGQNVVIGNFKIETKVTTSKTTVSIEKL